MRWCHAPPARTVLAPRHRPDDDAEDVNLLERALALDPRAVEDRTLRRGDNALPDAALRFLIEVDRSSIRSLVRLVSIRRLVAVEVVICLSGVNSRAGF